MTTRRSDEDRPRFVVQRHAATNLHFDFRLEVHGALVSWAVPKGPSLDPAEKRLAHRVGDHDMDHLEFEGRDARGHGPRTVIVWDIGPFDNVTRRRARRLATAEAIDAATSRSCCTARSSTAPSRSPTPRWAATRPTGCSSRSTTSSPTAAASRPQRENHRS